MKKQTTPLLMLFLIFLSASTLQAQQIKQLPEPQKEGGTPLMETLSKRHSSRDYAGKTLSNQMMSNLLWAAFGINRPESGKRTAPSSHNVQDIQVFVTTAEGVYLYLPQEHALRLVSEKDVRSATGKQDFTSQAAVNLVYVSDFSRYDGGDKAAKRNTASAHCGFIGQNVYLYCASQGLNTVFRAWIDKEKIARALNLSGNQHVMYCQSVGFKE